MSPLTWFMYVLTVYFIFYCKTLVCETVKTNAVCKELRAFPSLQLGDRKTLALSNRQSKMEVSEKKHTRGLNKRKKTRQTHTNKKKDGKQEKQQIRSESTKEKYSDSADPEYLIGHKLCANKAKTNLTSEMLTLKTRIKSFSYPLYTALVIGLTRERFVALGLPSWTHLRIRYWGVFTLQGLKDLVRGFDLWYCESWGIGENEKVKPDSTTQRCFL